MKQQYIHTIEKYIDGELSENELAEFLQLLEDNSEVRDELSHALEFKGMAYCSQHSKYDNLEKAVLSELDSPESDLENKVIDFLEKEDKRTAFPSWIIPVLVAQLLLVPLLYFAWDQPPSTKTLPLEIAVIQQSKGYNFIVRGDEKINIQDGVKLYSGDQFYVQDGGQINLSYKDGSTLNFLDNSFVRLSEQDGRKKVELFSGQLQADIEKQLPNKQMLIVTEHSTCEILGTSFSLSSSDVSSLLDVTEGKVRFKHEDKSLLVPADYYASAGGEAEFKVTKSDRALYKSPLITAQTPGHQIPIKVDIKGAKKIYLVVSNGGINNRFDHAVWLAPRLTGANGELDLVKHPWKIAKCGAYRIMRNRGYHGGAISVNGEIKPKGISAHATSILSWDIPPGYETFEAIGAILDSGINQKKSIPSMNFEIYTSMPEKKLKQLLIRRHHY